MAVTWRIRRFRELVASLRDEEGAKRAHSAALGLEKNFDAAGAHLHQFRQIIEGLEFPAGLPGEGQTSSALRQIWYEAQPGERPRPIIAARSEAVPQLIAFFRALHAATDLLGPVAYYGLGLYDNPQTVLKENGIYPGTVRDKLRRMDLHLDVATAIDRLLEDQSYRYLRAVSNTTKHRGAVPANFGVTMVAPSPRHGIRIYQFEYEGTLYDQRWADEYLEGGRKVVYDNLFGAAEAVTIALEDAHGHQDALIHVAE